MPTVFKAAFSCCQAILLCSPSPLTPPLPWMTALHCHFLLQIINASPHPQNGALFLSLWQSRSHQKRRFMDSTATSPCLPPSSLISSVSLAVTWTFHSSLWTLLTYQEYCSRHVAYFSPPSSVVHVLLYHFHQHAGLWLFLLFYKILLLNPLLQLFGCSAFVAECLQKVLGTHCLQLVFSHYLSWKQLFWDIRDI